LAKYYKKRKSKALAKDAAKPQSEDGQSVVNSTIEQKEENLSNELIANIIQTNDQTTKKQKLG
jgi:hypothetical protein